MRMDEAKASLNIKPRNIMASLIHNARIYNLSYAIDTPDKNETKTYIPVPELRGFLNKIKADYQQHSKYNKRLPSNATPIKEGILNINAHHTFEEIEKCAMETARMMGVDVLSISVHRDEGHIDEDGNKNYNLHAHILYNYYDFDTHKVTRHPDGLMRKVQDRVAEILGMERGQLKEITKRKHIPHGQYRAIAKAHDEKTRLTVKALKEEIAELKQQMIAKNKELEGRAYSKEDYQILQEIKRSLNKNTLSEVKEAINAFKSDLAKAEEALKEKTAQIVDLEEEIIIKDAEKQEAMAGVVKRALELIDQQEDTHNAKIKDLQAENKRLKTKELTIEAMQSQMQNTETRLNSQIESLRSENNALKRKNEVLDDQTQKTAQIANLELLKKERLEKIEAEVQKELVAQTVAEIAKDRVDVDLNLMRERVLKLGGLPAHFATEEIGWGFEAPQPKKEEIEIAKRAYPDLAFDTIDFPMSVAVKTAFTIINERIDNFISKLQKMMNSIGAETIEAYERSFDMQENTEIDNDEAYDHSQDNSSYLMP